MNKKEKKKEHAFRFFAISLAVMIVCSVFIWGFQTSWGDVTIKRLTLTSEDGTTVTTLVYIPKTATDDDPAPCVVIMHGRSNQAHSNDTWCLELARRGYVVFSPDLQGGGESDPDVDRSTQAITVTEYANSQSYVISDEINLVGYSAGCATCLEVYYSDPDIINSICEVFGPFMMQISEGADSVETNFCLIKSTADQYDYYFVGDPDDCLEYVESSVLATGDEIVIGEDNEKNGYLFRYAEVEGTLHQTGNISKDTITEIVSFVTDVSEAPVSLEATNQVWLWQQIFSGIACVNMMFLLAAFINLLMQTPFFAEAGNSCGVINLNKRRGAKAWIVDIIFAIVIPAILFVPVSAYAIKWTGEGTFWSKFLTSANLNGIMVWLICLAIIAIIRKLISALRAKKAGSTLTVSNFSIGAEGETKIKWIRPAKALLMGVIAVSFIAALLWLAEGFLGINYQIWNLSTYLKISPMRIVRAIPYMIIIFFAMFTGNMSQRLLPSTGNEKRDMWIAVAVNTVMTAAALLVLLIIQYGGSMIIGTGQTLIPQIDIYGTGLNTSTGSLDYAFGYCYMMGGTSGVVTYLNRKYGNIWVGTIPCAIFAGLVTLASFTIIA